MELWTIDILEKKLEHLKKEGKLKQWAIYEEEVNRDERYFIRDQVNSFAIDQARNVVDSALHVKIEVDKNSKVGSAQRKIFPQLELNKQLEELIVSAALGEEAPWTYENKPDNTRAQFNHSDPLILESTAMGIDRLSANLDAAINENRSQFNSAEIFVSKIKSKVKLSNGFAGSDIFSRIYAEVCFSSEDAAKKNAEEFMVKKYSTRLDQIDFSHLCKESLEYSQKSLDTQKPVAGKYPIILSSAELNQLFHDLCEHLNAKSKYYGTPFIDKGDELIPQFQGDTFQLSLDPEMQYALESRGFDHYGEIQKKIILVDNNKVKKHIVDKKMADYLSWEKTTSEGVVVVEPTKMMSENQLRKCEPKVLEILQLSALFSNASDLTFSSEIRLARLWDNQTGKTSYIKGGSISGNFKESFAKVRWLDRKRMENADDLNGMQSYYGPGAALLMDVHVAS